MFSAALSKSLLPLEGGEGTCGTLIWKVLILDRAKYNHGRTPGKLRKSCVTGISLNFFRHLQDLKQGDGVVQSTN